MAEELLLQSQKANHYRLVDSRGFDEIKKKAKAVSEEVRIHADLYTKYLKVIDKLNPIMKL